MNILLKEYEEYELTYPKASWAEQDADVLWYAVRDVTRRLLKGNVCSKDIISVSFSSQTPCLILLDDQGFSLRPCISWLDARASAQAKRVDQRFGADALYRTTGTILSGKDIICKLLWLKEEEEDIFRKAHKIIDAKDYLIFKLTGNFVTDWSCASLFSLFDIRKREWCDELCELAGISSDNLSEPHPSTDVVGEVTSKAASETGLNPGTTVLVGASDVACATLGSGAVRSASSHLYLGTSSWVCTSADAPVFDPLRRLMCCCHADPDKWLVIGDMQNAGSCLKWFVDELGATELTLSKERSVSPYRILDEQAASVEAGCMNLIFIPYMLGENSPIYDPHAKAGFIGLTYKHTRSHLIRSILEGTAYHMRWIIETIEEVYCKIDDLKVLGGGANSQIWLEIIANVTGKTLNLVENPLEAGARGSLMIALVGLNFKREFNSVWDNVASDEKKTFSPSSGLISAKYDHLYNLFKVHYSRARDIYREMSSEIETDD